MLAFQTEVKKGRSTEGANRPRDGNNCRVLLLRRRITLKKRGTRLAAARPSKYKRDVLELVVALNQTLGVCRVA